MMWKQGSRKSKDGANEREIAPDKQSKATRNDEQPENAKSKKRIVLIAFGALLALCIAIGMSNCAASHKEAESIKRPSSEQVKKNARTDSNANKDKAGEKSQKAEGNLTDEPSGGNADTSKPETGGNSTSSGNGGSTGNGGNSGSNGSSENKPQHVHNWIAQTTTVHHDAVYKTVCVCNGCGAQFDTDDSWGAHSESQLMSGNYGCGSYSPNSIVVSPAWDETVTTGYACSGCGATK